MRRAGPIVIVQAGRPPEDLRVRFGEQPDWFHAALSETGREVEVVRPFAGDALPECNSFACAIVTGSWSMVTDHEEWSEQVATWIREIVPMGGRLFGVCYGHQLMAQALGGEVGYHPEGREVGHLEITVTAEARKDVLLQGSPVKFSAFLTHEQSVLQLPRGATVLARSGHDPHQILRYSEGAISTQFHPEFTPEIMRACIERRRTEFTLEGKDVDAMVARLEPTTFPRQILLDFCSI